MTLSYNVYFRVEVFIIGIQWLYDCIISALILSTLILIIELYKKCIDKCYDKMKSARMRRVSASLILIRLHGV